MCGILEHIKSIEKSAYPVTLHKMQGMKSMRDFLKYCEATCKDDVIILQGVSWYFIANKPHHEIIDIASIDGMTMRDLITVKKSIWDSFKGKLIKMDAMDSTSYKFIKKIGGQIIENKPFLKNQIPFHKIQIWLEEK